MELPIRIAAWRRAKGLTLADLARAVGVTVSAISHHESGDSEPTHDNLVALVTKGLRLSMSRFYGHVPESAERSAREAAKARDARRRAARAAS